MRNIHILIAVLTLFPLGAIAQAPLSDITTPKESIGFNMGDDYCLANNVQMESYWRTLARESDRMSLEVIGESEGPRDPLGLPGERRFLTLFSSTPNGTLWTPTGSQIDHVVRILDPHCV